MSKKKKIGLIALCIIAVLIMVISVSYAYFTSVISGTANPNVITSGTMRLEFTDGPAISLSDALPGTSVTKTFSVKNTGTLTTTYDVYFSEICNMFVDKTDLVYTIRHTSANGYELLTETEVPSTSSKIIDSQSIAPNETQTYEITIKFLNKDENQDDNQGAHFSSKLNINNSREPISCPIKVGNTLCSFNCDTDNDGVADTNLDNNNDGICDLNCDNNNDNTCDTNCDTTGNGVCDYNCYDSTGNRCILNCDIDKDGTPDINVDTTGDGQADTNIDDNGDGRCDRNCSSGGIGGDLAVVSRSLYDTIMKAESKSISTHGGTAPDFTIASETDDGMYKAIDDLGDVYYYRGAVQDNYVMFGGFCWRVVRTNGDHSVRLIYQGKSCSASGDNAVIGISSYNSPISDNAYVGYMYGTPGSSTYAATHANINSSNAKTQLENWYATNLSSYDDLIADQIFCNDRQSFTDEQGTIPGGGYGTTETYYAPSIRTSQTHQPVLTCTNAADKFTKSSANGNGALSQKVGMLTIDEAIMAGEKDYTNNYSYYLVINRSWWLGSPVDRSNAARVYNMDYPGSIYGVGADYASGLRPVISLASSVKVLLGDGTKINPWVIKTLNVDKNNDGICDLNCDKNNNGKCDLNCDINGDEKADTNIDSNNDGVCDNICDSSINIPSDASLSANSIYKMVLASESTSIAAHKNTAPSFTGVSTTDEGMYKTKDDLGTVYYYRGDVEDNYVSFAGLCWRVVRTNGDKSVRLIYQGTTCNATDYYTTIGSFAYNSSNNDNAYVGYMYGTARSSSYEETHANINSSNAKTQLENWYATNLSTYDSLIADQIFCNDRSLSRGWRTDTGQGYSYNSISYGAFGRALNYDGGFTTTQYPTLMCTQATDKFTKSTSIGNGKLSEKVGMLTYDEAVMAGGFGGTNNNDYYLNTGAYWWLGSPSYMNSSYANIFSVNNSGNISVNYFTDSSNGLRPVISLLPSVEVSSGNGTQSNPWVIKILNIDYNNDGKCDLNCDTNNDDECDLNCDMDNNNIADKNIDYNNDGICDNNCDSPVLTSQATPIFDNTIAENSLYNTIVTAERESITAHGNTFNQAYTGISETDEGMYKSKDDLGDVYYYRGNVQDNYVSFGGFCWRVVRTNGDHSVRLIYQGNTCTATGDNTAIGKYVYNSNNNDNASVGYMFGTPGSSTYEETHANINSSGAKYTLENWYSARLSTYDDYIADQIFCNDRKITIGSGFGTGKGYGNNKTAYGAVERSSVTNYYTWAATQYATLICPQDNDKFTKSSVNGNGKLSQKVGLLTYDEAIMAGGFAGTNNTSYYLNTGASWWLGSPNYAESNYVAMFGVTSNGYVGRNSITNSSGYRPVISLNNNVEVTSGNGTQSNPWVIKTN